MTWQPLCRQDIVGGSQLQTGPGFVSYLACIAGSNEAVNAILGRRSLIAGLDSMDSHLSLACRLRLLSSALPNCREGLVTRLISQHFLRFRIMGGMWCLLVK